jgi:hypothetical protein
MRLTSLLLLVSLGAASQTWKGNHDESKVKPYTLPDPLTLLSGKKVKTPKEWTKIRRPEVLGLFEHNVYGHTPASRIVPRYQVVSSDRDALDGKATRKQITISFPGHESGPKIHMLVYLPVNAKGPAPLFLGLNFGGNQTVHTDPGITLHDIWTREQVRKATSEESRGRGASQWQVERILARGYGLATAYYGDIEPDFDGGIKYGVRRILPASDWGAIGAWAWGLSRMMDYLETDKDVDAKHVAVMGHSRLGKTALWAGAQDERFAIVISNDSGEGGAALSKRNFGEDIWRINNSFPHWFSTSYRQYSNKEADLPVDQHMLLALIAPRPLYVASAVEDLHSDPRGEFLSAVHAGPVYELLGRKGLGTDEMPGLHQPIMNTVAYHIRAGKHDVTAYDWDRYCDFADMHWRK